MEGAEERLRVFKGACGRESQDKGLIPLEKNYLLELDQVISSLSLCLGQNLVPLFGASLDSYTL